MFGLSCQFNQINAVGDKKKRTCVVKTNDKYQFSMAFSIISTRAFRQYTLSSYHSFACIETEKKLIQKFRSVLDMTEIHQYRHIFTSAVFLFSKHSSV